MNGGPGLVYQIKVTLRGVRPPIWRRLQVPGDITLASLHETLQTAMGWTDSHLHQFVIGGRRYGVRSEDGWDDALISEARVRLDEVARKGSWARKRR